MFVNKNDLKHVTPMKNRNLDSRFLEVFLVKCELASDRLSFLSKMGKWVFLKTPKKRACKPKVAKPSGHCTYIHIPSLASMALSVSSPFSLTTSPVGSFGSPFCFLRSWTSFKWSTRGSNTKGLIEGRSRHYLNSILLADCCQRSCWKERKRAKVSKMCGQQFAL